MAMSVVYVFIQYRSMSVNDLLFYFPSDELLEFQSYYLEINVNYLKILMGRLLKSINLETVYSIYN